VLVRLVDTGIQDSASVLGSTREPLDRAPVSFSLLLLAQYRRVH